MADRISYTEDDEKKMFALPDPIYSPRSQVTITGPSLDLSNAQQDSKQEHDGVQEDEIIVVFDLPDGSQSDSKFRLGQTVEVLKSFVESEFGIPMQHQVLRSQGKIMMDPLSLLDFPEAKGMLVIDMYVLIM